MDHHKAGAGDIEPYGPNKGSFVKRYVDGDFLHFHPGDEVARFQLGSTVVLVFEAEQFDFVAKPGQRVKMGQALGYNLK